MLWKVAVFSYMLINVIGIAYFKKMLRHRLQNSALIWLFSISLSLSITFLLALVVISLYIRSFHMR